MSESNRTPDDEVAAFVQLLAQPGWTVRAHSYEDGYEYFIERPRIPVRGDLLTRMIGQGWLQGFNGGYRLSDDGRKAHLHSTDEMGDGKLVPPTEWP